jgi:hypothetical protein
MSQYDSLKENFRAFQKIGRNLWDMWEMYLSKQFNSFLKRQLSFSEARHRQIVHISSLASFSFLREFNANLVVLVEFL